MQRYYFGFYSFNIAYFIKISIYILKERTSQNIKYMQFATKMGHREDSVPHFSHSNIVTRRVPLCF